MTDVLRLLFSFNGRINRSQFWLGLLLLILIVALLGGASGILEFALGPSIGLSMFGPAVALLAYIPLLAICAKRFRDIGWPLWVLFALTVVVAAPWLEWQFALGWSEARALLLYANVAAVAAILIPCGFMRGQPNEVAG